MEKEKIRTTVRLHYAEAAGGGCGGSPAAPSCCEPSRDLTLKAQGRSCCGPPMVSSCCETAPAGDSSSDSSQQFAYTEDDIKKAPNGSYLGLGCGNPLSKAVVKSGETVLDLGSGGGFDCFLAARQVGEDGRIIGVDMTPEMVSKSRENSERADYGNVEFRLGEMENLPVADESVDIVISNCVINLSPDKPRVYSEVSRVLKPGGRLIVSDMVSRAPVPDDIHKDPDLYVGCIAGASFVDDLKDMLNHAGFQEIGIQFKEEDPKTAGEQMTNNNIRDFVCSATVEAVKSKQE
ncbi:MAG: arsenite methyltransferase [Deltaproteobacteria bacterium]|nr:arsenite methyltransferase [Deltaproteobacteria bacterium]